MRIIASNNDPYDFCLDCTPSESEAEERFVDMGDGPDERGNCFEYDADHPPYDDWEMFCYNCNSLLTDYQYPSSFFATL